MLRPVFDATRRPGRPGLHRGRPAAGRTTPRATIAEARRCAGWSTGPTRFIKIPATEEGLPAITETIGEGISVNVTLIFSLERYRAVIDAYMAGLEKAEAAGLDLSQIHSVASFFVSRVDTEVDKRLDKIGTDEAKALRGKAAVANARLAYEVYEQVFATDRWRALERAGAQLQRPLWASTGVKDPALPDTLYVTELVAPDTVNTMPEATLDAVADHGEIRGDTVRGTYDAGPGRPRALAKLGICYDDVVQVLEDEGVEKFADVLERPAGVDQGRAQAPRPDGGAERLEHRQQHGATRCATPRDRRIPRVAGPSGLVMFGVTGDLARKKLMPAIYDLANRGLLPPGFSLVGFARRDWEHEDFAQVTHDAVKEHARTPFREEVWQQLAEGIRFVPGEFDDDEAFERLAGDLASWTRSAAPAATTPSTCRSRPRRSRTVVQQLKRSGCPTRTEATPGAGWSSRSRSATT